MRKSSLLGGIVVIAVLFLGTARSAQAQLEVGVTGGINFAKGGFDPSVQDVVEDLIDIDFTNVTASNAGVTGAVFGATLTMPVTAAIDFRVEALFSQLGTKFSAGSSILGLGIEVEQRTRLNVLEIPFLINVPLIENKVCIQGGGLVGLKLSQSATVKSTVLGATTEVTLDDNEAPAIKSSFFGIAVGGEVRLSTKLAVGGRFNLGLTNLDDDPESPFDSVTVRSGRAYAVYRLQ